MTPRASIVVIDDSRELLELLGQVLRADGFEVRQADSGELGLASVRAAPPDLILLDLRMPGMDGFEVCRQLKLDAATADIPVILLSGMAATDDWVRGLQLGAVDYISKPVQRDELTARVRTQLARRAAELLASRQAATLRETSSRLDAEVADREASEAFYREQFDRNPTPTLLLDSTDGTIVEVNRAALRFYGYAKEAMVGENIALLNRLDSQRVRDTLAAALHDGGVRLEVTHRLADGRLRDIHSALTPVRYGHRTFVQLFVEDVTDQLAAARALRESEERHRQLLSVLPDGVVVHNGGRIAYCNAAFAAMVGADSEPSLFGREIWEFIPEGERDAVRERLRASMASGARSELHDLTLLRADGGRTPAEVCGVPIELNGTTLILAILRDVTDRRRALEALTASERELREAERIAHVGHWRWNTQTNQVFWSDEMKHIWELDPADLKDDLDKVIAERVHPEDRAKVEAANQAVLNEARPGPSEYRLLLPDGRERTIIAVPGRVVKDAEGRVVQLSGIVQDVTDAHSAEAERSLLLSQLTHAQKLESVGRLAGGVAHDYNNMLSVILGSLEMALAELEDAHPVREDLKQAQLAALRSSDLTRRLLTFARRQVLQARPLDVNDVIGESARLMRPLLGEEIDFAWLPGPGLWRVVADDSQLQQAVANLCVNARDAIEGTGRIEIRTDNVVLTDADVAGRDGAKAGEWVRVTVSDTGRGMSAEVLEKAFEPFFTTKGVGQGTGLGLSTVHGAVAQHGGFVQLRSVLGQGTTFELYLPRMTEGSL